MTTNQPISRLDERVDAMLRALGRMPNLPKYLEAMRVHEEVVAQMSPEFPGVVDALAGTEFRRAVIDVMDEVVVLAKKGAEHGNP